MKLRAKQTWKRIKAQNRANFKTLAKILEEEKIEIIKLGFQLQAIAKQYVALLREGKIFLKKYYEGVSEANSLFQLRGYRIKYESIKSILFMTDKTLSTIEIVKQLEKCLLRGL